ncbi:MAG: DUF4258 domain-containing protein [Candidatus Stahlbacteria bacterium]|nr:DUF4258 domain-containing protein [Candidatus Stahlbacteria bacterium]
MLTTIQKCFEANKVLYTTHARREMQQEEHGTITESEVTDTVQNSEIIEIYKNTKPYPSFLLCGKTIEGKPFHIVLAYCEEDDVIIIITVYQPDPARWVDYKRRRKK